VLEPGVIAPNFPPTDAPVQIASIPTIARRLEQWRDRFDVVIVDECHHAVSPTWRAVLASQPNAHVLGVTATPERPDGSSLRVAGFQALIMGPIYENNIANGARLTDLAEKERAQPPRPCVERFEASFAVSEPACAHRPGAAVIGVYGGHFRNRRRPAGTNHLPQTDFSASDAHAAMGISWKMTTTEISRAIPPVYAQFIAGAWRRGCKA
jgi:hypothetical protein